MVARSAETALFVKATTSLIRIAIADAHTLLREGIRALLQLEAGLMVAIEISDAADLVAQLVATRCDVLLLDRSMPLGSVDVRELSESVKVLLLCNDADDAGDALNGVRAGARGVVFLDSAVSALIDAIRTVAEGRIWMPPELQARVAESLQEESQHRLTPREREIVCQVALGRRNGEIGKELFISEQTVKTHLGRIFRKLGVRDRVALTLYASRRGLVSIAETRR